MSDLLKQALDVFDAFMQEFRPQVADSILYKVARRIITKIGDPNLLEDEVNLLAQQVLSEFQTLGISSVPPSDRSRELAQQVADEVEEFRNIRSQQLDVIDVTQPADLGNLEVSANLRFNPSN